MKDRDIYVRTDKGAEEVAHRSKGLNSICRHVLILINGQSTVGELADRAPDSWQIRDKLAELESTGLISTGKTTKVAVAPAPVIESIADPVVEQQDETEATDAPADVALNLIDALIAAAEQTLGGSAAKVVARIKNSGEDDAAIKTTVDSCVKLVTLIVSESKAVELRKAFDQVLGNS